MSNYLCLMLPFPPSVNGLFAGKARRYKSARDKAWEEDAWRALVKQGIPALEPIYTAPVSVTLAYGRPDRRTRDLDNYSKSVLDMLVTAKALADDSLIHRLLAYWCEDVTGVRVEIEPMGATA